MRKEYIQSAKTEVEKVAKTGQLWRQTARSQATSRPREQEQRHAIFYAFLPLDI